MGRYEDMNVIEIENPEDIVSIFEAAVYDFEDTIALVSDRELIAYTLHDIIKNDSMNISYVDLPDDYDECVEYFIKVDKDGNITCGELDDWYCINDVNVAKYLSPPLTTIHIDIPCICETALDMLRNRVLYGSRVTKLVFVNGTPIFRKSC